MSKQGLGKGIIVALVLVLGVGTFLTYKIHKPTTAPITSNTNEPGVYRSEYIDIQFNVKDTYQVNEGHGGEEGPSYVITLMDKGALPVGANTESPPAIAIQEFENPKNLALDEWIRTTGASNWELSSKSEMGASTVGDEAGLGYTYSGLYEATAIAVAHNGKIYLFTVDTLTPEDKIKTDFFSLLDTVQFI